MDGQQNFGNWAIKKKSNQSDKRRKRGTKSEMEIGISTGKYQAENGIGMKSSQHQAISVRSFIVI